MALFLRKFPEELHYELKVRAAQMRMSLANLVIKILTDWLEPEKEEGK